MDVCECVDMRMRVRVLLNVISLDMHFLLCLRCFLFIFIPLQMVY